MTRRGFTLVELLVVIGLISILLAMATFGFSQYTRKSGIHHQTRLLNGDLMEYRVKAMYEKKNWTVKIDTNRYDIYSSPLTTVTPVKTVTLKYPVETTNTFAIVYDNQGTANVGKTICVIPENDAAVDAIVVSTTRVQIGKKQAGATCAADNIDAK